MNDGFDHDDRDRGMKHAMMSFALMGNLLVGGKPRQPSRTEGRLHDEPPFKPEPRRSR